MQFTYISGCVFAAYYNFKEFLNLYRELFTLPIINIIKDSKTAGIFFIKELV